MKPLFCYDNADKDELLTGEELVVDKIPDELSSAIDAEIEKDIKALNKEFGLPFNLHIAAFLLFAIAFMFACTSAIKLYEVGKLSLNVIMEEYLWLAAIPVIMAVIGVVLLCFSKKLRNEDDNSAENSNQSNSEYLETQARLYHKIPNTARELEILNLYFKQKDNKLKLLEEEENWGTDSSIFDAYTENDTLILVSLKEKYAIPLNTITGLSEIKRKTSVWWLEEEDPDKEFLKRYNLKYVNDNVVSKYIYSLNISKDGEEYCLYLTPYEVDKLKEIIGKNEYQSF